MGIESNVTWGREVNETRQEKKEKEEEEEKFMCIIVAMDELNEKHWQEEAVLPL